MMKKNETCAAARAKSRTAKLAHGMCLCRACGAIPGPCLRPTPEPSQAVRACAPGTLLNKKLNIFKITAVVFFSPTLEKWRKAEAGMER